MNLEVDQFSATSPNPVLRVDKDGTILYSNKAGEPLLNKWGVGVGEKLSSNIGDLVQRVILRNSPEKMEVKVGKGVYLIVFHPLSEEKDVCISGFDISDQKEIKEKVQESEAQEMPGVVQQEREIAVAFLSLMNENKRTVELVHSAVNFFRERFGLEAVGVRLQQGDAYPYFETGGFPVEFVRMENSLYAWDEVGQPICDNAGNPIQECMCGNVICGRFDPSKPFFTARGSFWTNSTTELLAATIDADCQALMRNRCNGMGYESVALIALRVDENMLGLLQLNDTRKGQFSPETITTWERLAGYLAVALAKARVEEFLLEAYETLLIQSEKLKVQSEELQVTNKELNEKEKRFRTMANAIPQLTWIARPDGYIYWYNERWYAYTGSTPKQIEGWGWQSVHDPEVLPKVLDRWHASIATGQIFDMEFPMRGADGIFRPFLTRVLPLKDADGHILQWFGTHTDIMELKETEAKLKETLDNLEELVKKRTEELEIAFKSLKANEESLAEAQKMAHIGNWDWDLVDDEMHWSDEMYCIFGLTFRKLGSSYKNVLNCTHPDDRSYVDNAVKRALCGKPFNIDHRIISADGEERVVHAQGEVVFDEKNIPLRMKGTVQDITERIKSEEKLRESEEKYRNIVETANEGILIIDNETTITYANKKLAAMIGYTLKEIICRSVWDFLVEESKTIVKLHLKNRRLGIDDSYELKLIKKDGSTLWVSVNAKSLFNKDGAFVGSMSMLTDITGRKEAEQALANFKIAREKEIHHRIKNNLQVVSSLLDLQAYKFKGRNNVKDSEIIDAFRESQSRVKSMALIHEELYRGGGSETLNFSAYIDELADNLLSTYKLENNDIILNKDMDKDIFLDMDTAIPLGIIINEIISNSFKHAFSGRDKGEIRIKFHREEKGDFVNIGEEGKCEDCKSTNFILSVSDNGVGIPENLDIEDLDSLGLQLVTSLVEQLTGELVIKRNNGTEFTIKFIATEKNNQPSAPVPNDCSEAPKFKI